MEHITANTSCLENYLHFYAANKIKEANYCRVFVLLMPLQVCVTVLFRLLFALDMTNSTCAARFCRIINAVNGCALIFIIVYKCRTRDAG